MQTRENQKPSRRTRVQQVSTEMPPNGFRSLTEGRRTFKELNICKQAKVWNITKNIFPLSVRSLISRPVELVWLSSHYQSMNRGSSWSNSSTSAWANEKRSFAQIIRPAKIDNQPMTVTEKVNLKSSSFMQVVVVFAPGNLEAVHLSVISGQSLIAFSRTKQATVKGK